MKRSVGTSRNSKGAVRISFLGAGSGTGSDAQIRASLRMSMSKIPVRNQELHSDNNVQTAQERKSRSVARDSSKRGTMRGSSAAGRTSATPCRINPTGKSAQTPSFNEHRRSQSAHSPYTPSVFGAISGKRGDCRPINDKQFQNQAMIEVYSYFQENTTTISNICPKPGTRSIMIKTFYELVSQLLCKFFPTVNITGSNYVTEIPLLMKALRYPGTMSTSWLKSANTMHAWPHVVAILSWLVDLAKTTEEDISSFVRGDGDQSRLFTAEELFNYASAYFGPWNEQNLEYCDELDEEFISAVKERSGVTEENFEAVRRRVQALEDELNNPKVLDEIAHVQQLEDRCKTLTIKEIEMIKSIESEKRKIKDLEEEKISVRHKQKELGERKQRLLEQLADIKKTIATQQMSKSRANEIYQECNDMEMKIQQQIKYKENIDKLAYNAMLKSGGLQKKLEKWSLDYNTSILKLGLANPKKVQLDMKANMGSAQKEWVEKLAAFDSLLQNLNEVIASKEEELSFIENQEQEQIEESAKFREELEKLHVEESLLKKQGKKLLSEFSKKEKDILENIRALEVELQNKFEFDGSCEGLQSEFEEATKIANQRFKECEEFQEQALKFIKSYHEQINNTFTEIGDALQRTENALLLSLSERIGLESKAVSHES